jgi:hypothetical protein
MMEQFAMPLASICENLGNKANKALERDSKELGKALASIGKAVD